MIEQKRVYAPEELLEKADFILEKDLTKSSDYLWKKTKAGWLLLANRRGNTNWKHWAQENLHKKPSGLPASQVTFEEIERAEVFLELLCKSY